MSKVNSWFNRDDNGEQFERTHSYRQSAQNQARAAATAAASKTYNSMVVYRPRTAEDVQILINHMRKHEPVIANLDGVPDDIAQRILDFVSGAIYALSGSVHRISGNIFLLTPEGVEIAVPYDNY